MDVQVYFLLLVFEASRGAYITCRYRSNQFINHVRKNKLPLYVRTPGEPDLIPAPLLLKQKAR